MTTQKPKIKVYNISPASQPLVLASGAGATVHPGEHIELEEHEAKDLASSFPDRFALKLPKHAAPDKD